MIPPPSSELFRKFIRFGRGMLPLPWEWDGVKKVRYESLDRDVVGTHEKPLVEEEEEPLEGFEERPLGEEAEALVGQHPALLHIFELVESKQLPLVVGEQGLVVLLVEAQRAAVQPAHHPVALLGGHRDGQK